MQNMAEKMCLIGGKETYVQKKKKSDKKHFG